MPVHKVAYCPFYYAGEEGLEGCIMYGDGVIDRCKCCGINEWPDLSLEELEEQWKDERNTPT